MYTLGTGGACVLLLPDEDVSGRGVSTGLDGMAAGFAGLHHIAYNLVECDLTGDTSNKQCSVSCLWFQ